MAQPAGLYPNNHYHPPTLSNMVHIPFFAAGFFFAAVFFGAALGSDMDLKISLLTLSSSSSLITVAAESIFFFKIAYK